MALSSSSFCPALPSCTPPQCPLLALTPTPSRPLLPQLDALYVAKGYAGVISKADLYVLAGNTVIQYASTLGPLGNLAGLSLPAAPLVLPFQYGRVDAA